MGDFLNGQGLFSRGNYYGEVSETGVVSHAIAGCVTGVEAGARCGPSALSAAFSQAATPLKQAAENPVAGLAISMIVGGTASELGGGKFVNGAETAAEGYLYNWCDHDGNCANFFTNPLNDPNNPLHQFWNYIFGPSTAPAPTQATNSIGFTGVLGMGGSTDIGPAYSIYPDADGNRSCSIVRNTCFIAGPMAAATIDATFLSVSPGTPGDGWSLSVLGKASVPIGGVQLSAGASSDGPVFQAGRSWGDAFGVAVKYCRAVVVASCSR